MRASREGDRRWVGMRQSSQLEGSSLQRYFFCAVPLISEYKLSMEESKCRF